MLCAHYLTTLDALRCQPAARVVELHTAGTGDDDPDPADLLAAERELRTDCDALAVLLAERWGEPATLDLTDHLVRLAEGGEVPEPERTLCGLVTELRVWVGEDRWIGVGVARWSESGPLQLVAAVGEKGRKRPSDPAGLPGPTSLPDPSARSVPADVPASGGPSHRPRLPGPAASVSG